MKSRQKQLASGDVLPGNRRKAGPGGQSGRMDRERRKRLWRFLRQDFPPTSEDGPRSGQEAWFRYLSDNR